METNVKPSTLGTVVILMATSSLFIMLSLNEINYIVHRDLYNYGLLFSNIWAIPYWVFSGLVFGFCWVSLSLSIIVTLYVLKRSRARSPSLSEDVSEDESVEAVVLLKEGKDQRKLSEYLPQKKELFESKEELEETLTEEVFEDEVRQPEETAVTVETHEIQVEGGTEEQLNSTEETEVPIPPGDVEQHQ